MPLYLVHITESLVPATSNILQPRNFSPLNLHPLNSTPLISNPVPLAPQLQSRACSHCTCSPLRLQPLAYSLLRLQPLAYSR